MDPNTQIAGILRDLVQLATENVAVRAGNLSEEDYLAHCDLVEKRIQAAFPINHLTKRGDR